MNEKTCKVFTPLEVVKYMLDKIGYTDNLYGKKVLENSCGKGAFLCEVVRRYILDGQKNHRSVTEIKTGLESDIYGIEKEQEVREICIHNVNEAAEELGIQGVNWNIQLGDALSIGLQPIFQYVIGNPPYITYYNLPIEDRELIKMNYQTCRTGKADYYYAFTEAALNALAPDGVMAYLIPNNFMKNRYSEDMRSYLLPYLVEIEDYKFEKLFDSYQTSSAIVVCTKTGAGTTFIYRDREDGSVCNISKKGLAGKWVLDHKVAEQCAGKPGKRFGDCFKVAAPVATLLNDAFVIKDYVEADEWIEKDTYRLEKAGLRPAASAKSKQYNESNYIIFPYYYENGKCCRYPEEEFRKRFPQIEAYLQQYKTRLSERKSDKRSQWFEYGRSQALAHIDQEKLMLSLLITDQVKYYYLDRETVPYSGMYIVPRENYTIKQAEEILSSQEFYHYIKSIGIHANGKTYRISHSDVENYMFEEKW